MSDEIQPTINPAACRTAIKLLQHYERLVRKLGKRLPSARLVALDRKRDAGTITSNDLPGALRAQVPGEVAGMTLDEIRSACGL